MTANRLSILGQRVDRLSFSEALDQITTLAQSNTVHHIITANTLMLLAAEHDLALSDLISKASVVVPESWGVAWASRTLQTSLQEFIPGIDLMSQLILYAARNNQPIALLGAKPGVARLAADHLLRLYPGLKVIHIQDGYFSSDEEEDVITRIRKARPTYLFVGMNVPYQEKWIAKHLEALQVPIVMGIGGSFDVLSGALKRAPFWMRRLGIEWVFRTLQQPWRIKRIKDLPVFMWHVWKSKEGRKRIPRPRRERSGRTMGEGEARAGASLPAKGGGEGEGT